MREGELLSHDGDIDISLWSEHEPELQKLLPIFRRAGYSRLIASYKGLNFQYSFTLPGTGESRPVDISLFRRCGEQAWCPEYYFRINPARSAGTKSPVTGAVRGGLRYLWRSLSARVPMKVTISAWPWRYFVNIGTWWLPACYFDHLEFNADLNAPVPAAWESYLTFRYGNWRVPVTDWVFHRDDRGFKDVPPHEVSGKLP